MKQRIRKHIPSLFVGLLFPLILSTSLFAVPNQISYQGILTDALGQPVADSTYAVTFGLYRVLAGGTSVWNESAAITTDAGSFSHTLGSITPFPAGLFESRDTLFLEILISSIPLTPRTRLFSSPYALQSGGLLVRASTQKIVMRTIADSATFVINTPAGDTAIILRGGIVGDSAVILPSDAVSSDEIKDEPGITVYINTEPVTLLTGMMTDIVTLEITVPDDGYLILEGKCYVELRGTTGVNRAVVQLDTDEGGSAQFPYYVLAGLSGYVNTGSNYFPLYVTRPYFVEKGTYTFRMEGRAQNALPAEAVAWDPVLNATYYRTAYEAVKSISTEAYPGGVSIQVDSLHPGNPERSSRYYLHDLRKRDRKLEKTEPQPKH